MPYVRNYFKNERLYQLLADFLAGLIAREHIDLVHGQHVMTLPAGNRRSTAHRVPVGVHGARLLAGVLLVRPHSHHR